MPPANPSPATVMALLGRGRAAEARRELAALARQSPKDAATWVCAAWVEHDARDVPAMRAAIERAAKFRAPAVILDILRATAANAAGDMDDAIACATRASTADDIPNRLLACAILGESLFLAHRMDELAAMLATQDAFRADPRGQLLQARVHRAQGRPDDAVAAFRGVFESNASTRVRRFAGAELAKHLDSIGRYAEAFAAAKAMHAATGSPYDTGGLVAEVEATAQLAARGAFKDMRRADGPIPPTALIASLPRSGTTLVEQMLDRHPAVVGIGESPGVHALASAFTSLGGWPAGVLAATQADLQRLRDGYLALVRAGSDSQRASGALLIPRSTMTFDKSLQTWRRLPAVAAALPGARLIRLRRDPRDSAISLFLSPMDPRTLGWNASLADIKRVIAVERRTTPGIAEALKLSLIDIRYEDLVSDPRGHLERVLAFLGLAWHEACLAPEGNARIAITLSNEQVRRPLNSDSIGRWKHYAEHFDASWDSLAD